jgi:predicted metal-binding membrane protein
MKLLGALAYVLAEGSLRWLLLLSAIAFAFLAAQSWLAGAPAWAVCSASSLESQDAALPAVAAWMLMVVAMLPPLLALPVGHVWISVSPRRRATALAGFGFGYAAAWLAAGVVLIPAGAALARLPPVATCAALIGLALLWSASPVAQASRNRCHRPRPIAPFGPKSLRDAVVQGLTSGAACVGACWVWMLVPAAAGGAHLAAMILVTLLLVLERLAPAAPPHWRWPPAVSMVAMLA